MPIERVAGMDQHPLPGERRFHGLNVGVFNILARGGFGIPGFDVVVEPSPARALGFSVFQGGPIVLCQPQPGIAPERRMLVIVPGLVGIGLNLSGIHGRVVVDVDAEHIARSIVGAADGGELDIALIFSLVPVNHIILAIHREIKAENRLFSQAAFMFGGESQAAGMNEIDFAIQSVHGNTGCLADALQRHFVHQQREHQGVDLGPLLPERGFPGHGKGCEARPATVSLRTGLGLAEKIIGLGG